MSRNRVLPVVAAAAAMSMLSAQIASAACTRLAFSVNDYGKEGPIRDAKNLLDKYIAKWAAERGIRGYNTGPKAVSCELFLDVIVFDEYTCKAEATVCWNGPLPKGHTVEAGAPTPSVNKAAPGGAQRAKAAPKAAAGDAPSAPGAAPIATGSVRAAPAVAPKATPSATPAAATPKAAPKAVPAAVAPAASRPAAAPDVPAAPAAAPAAPPAN